MTECYRIIATEEFEEWLRAESPRSQYQIDARLARIRMDGYFGQHKLVSSLESGLIKNKIWELKFNDGRRIYYAYVLEKNILLLLGGNKNGQDKDINKAKNIFLKKTKFAKKD